jgi:hypothetical protein
MGLEGYGYGKKVTSNLIFAAVGIDFIAVACIPSGGSVYIML